MIQPFIWPAAGLCFGIFLQSFIPFLPPHFFLSGAAIFGFCLWFFRGTRFFIPCFFLTWIFIGAAQNHLDQKIKTDDISFSACDPDKQAGGKYCPKVTVAGRVTTLPELSVRGNKKTASWILEAEYLDSWSKEQCREKKVSGLLQVFNFQPSHLPKPGTRIFVRGQLEKPRLAVNPGSFNYRRYLAGHGIHSVMTTFGTQFRELPSSSWSLARGVGRLQAALQERIEFFYPLREDSSLFEALILGVKKGISPELRMDFLKSGTSHLLAISGLNIALLAGSFYLFLIVSGLSQKKSAWAAIVVTWIETFVAGAAAPVVRAAIMASLAFGAIIFEREKPSLNSLWLAMMLMLLIDAKSLQDVSFQLSFLSLFSLMAIPCYLRLPRRLMESFGASLAALIGTFPLVLWHFQTFAPVAILANLFAIPFFHLALLSGIAALFLSLIAAGLAIPAAKLSTLCLHGGVAWIKLMAAFPFACLYFSKPPLRLVSLYYLSLALSLPFFRIPKHFRLFSFALLGTSSLLFFRPQSTNFELTFFASGQNEIAHIQAFNQHWLINSGSQSPGNQVRKIIEPCLRGRGAQTIEGVFLIDAGKKHSAGLETLRNYFNIRKIYAFPETLKKINLEPRKKYSMGSREPLLSGPLSFWNLGDFRGKMIFGFKEKDFSAIFLPDLNAAILNILQRRKDWSEVDVLMLAGGKEGRPGDWDKLFDRFDPGWVVVTKRNAPLNDFLKQRDIHLLALEDLGAITFRTEEAGIQVESFLKGSLLGKF